MDIDRNYYLVRINSLAEDTISTLCMSDLEYSTIVGAFKHFNKNSFYVDGTYVSSISYCETPFPTMHSAIEFYKENKQNIHWVGEVRNL